MTETTTPKRGRHRRRALALAGATIAGDLAVLRRRGYGLGGRVIVRCRAGHLFTTIWLPGASVKSLRLGPWRLQRCPVGPHLSLVTPVDVRTLDAQELADARRRDTRVP